MRYLYLNTFKSILSRKTFFIGIMIIMVLASTLYSLLLNTSSNLRASFADYKINQNIQDFSFTSQASLSRSDIENFLLENPEVNTRHRARLDAFYILFDDPNVTTAKFANVREDAMSVMSNYIDVLRFRLDSANVLAERYGFYFEPSHTKDIFKMIDGAEHAFRFMPHNIENTINIPFLIDGRLPDSPGEIAVFPEYLKANQLSIGDQIEIRNIVYTITGTFYAPNEIFPKIDLSSVFFDNKRQTVALVMPDDFNAIRNIDMESMFVAVFHDRTTDVNSIMMKLAHEPLASFALGYLDNLSIGGGLFIMLTVFDAVSIGVLTAFTIISLLIVLFVVRKKVIEGRKKLGILKSMGYSAFSISSSYIIFGILAGISAIIGFVIAMALKDLLVSAVKGFFVLPILVSSIDLSLLVISFFTLSGAVGLISVFTAYYYLRQKPIELLNPAENDGVHFITHLAAKLTEKMSFQNRFKYTLAARSASKLASIILLTILCQILITAIFISSNFLPALKRNFANYGYEYAITFDRALLESDPGNGLLLNDHVIIDVQGTIDEVNGIRTLNNKSSDGEFVHIMGIDSDNDVFPIFDMQQNIINTRTDGVIVTGNFLRQFGAQVGDIITITPKSKYDFRFRIPIVGLSSNFTDGPGVFLDRAFLNEKIGNEPGSFNVRLTSSLEGIELGTIVQDSVVRSIVSITDIINSYEQLASIARYVLVVLQIFMALLTMVLIGLLSNLVIEENSSQISLLKVLGFNKKEVNSMVLNIYMPFIVLAIALGIPATFLIGNAILYIVFGGANVAFPIELRIWQVILSAAIILTGYFLSLRLNRKSLDKIPITIALKRE